MRQIGKQHAEIRTTQPGDRIARSQGLLEVSSRLPQERVADVAAEHARDLAQFFQPHDQHRERPLRVARPRQGLSEAVFE